MEEVQVGTNYSCCHTTPLTIQQISYSLQLIKPVLDGLLSAFTVKADATDAYNAKIQERLSRTVHTQCYSWQRTNGTGKVFNAFPWAVTLWWWWLRRPNWAHYTAIDGQKWARRRTMEKMVSMLKVFAFVLLSLAYARRSALLSSLYEKGRFSLLIPYRHRSWSWKLRRCEK